MPASRPSYAQGEMFFLVTSDLCEGGELYNYLVFGSGIKKFEEPIARYFFKQVQEKFVENEGLPI